MRKNLTKTEILRRQKEIAALFSQSGSYFELYGCVRESGLKLLFGVRLQAGGDRFFVSPAKRLGKAVRRNRAKRLQREFYRHSKQRLREISQVALVAASREVLVPEKGQADVENLRSRALCFERQLTYHWGFIVYREAGSARAAAVQNREFVGECQRYSAVLHSLPKLLHKKWLWYFRQAAQSEQSVYMMPNATKKE